MDTSILIRSFAIEGTDVTLQAGGAITLDSDPSLEYEESLLKAASCQKALECSL
jgi:anthranilate/para-aminobenzoate synthase component I